MCQIEDNELGRNQIIEEKATEINQYSEVYHLMHATYAIEQLFRLNRKVYFENQVQTKWESMMSETDNEVIEKLKEDFLMLRKESRSNFRILIRYTDKIMEGCARTYRTSDNSFVISLPECMRNIRDCEGKISLDKLNAVRKLMAHELGHIVLHNGVLADSPKDMSTDDKEAEADYFADKLLELRDKYSQEVNDISAS